MKISLEKINKVVLIIGFVLLLFRNGSFSSSFIPKPFEMVFVIVALIAIIDVIYNKKIKEFFIAIPKKVWIALLFLFAAIFIGWGVATFFLHMSTTFNMVLEFGNFVISVATFLLVLFYSRNSAAFSKNVLYALLAPTLYIVFLIVPGIAAHFHLAQNDTFNGFTDNVNIVSKALLIPILFFITHAIFESKYNWKKIVYSLLSIGLVALVFWTAERGAILSMAIATVAIWILYIIKNPSWKKISINTILIAAIVGIGFLSVPYTGKKIALDRVLNTETHQSGSVALQNQSIPTIIQHASKAQVVSIKTESRVYIWAYYLRTIVKNPLGFGPNTHMAARIQSSQSVFNGPGPHNTYIEMLLWGGIIGLISFACLLIFGFKRILFTIQNLNNVNTYAVFGALFSLTLSIFFNDSLILTIFWILLALAITQWNYQK